MGSPVLPLNGSSCTLNRETTRCVLETPFHKDGLKRQAYQGSVLGARLFTMYTYKHKVEYHSYVDDTQVYLHCDNNVASLRHAVH